jgi:hypothetical protein
MRTQKYLGRNARSVLQDAVFRVNVADALSTLRKELDRINRDGHMFGPGKRWGDLPNAADPTGMIHEEHKQKRLQCESNGAGRGFPLPAPFD